MKAGVGEAEDRLVLEQREISHPWERRRLAGKLRENLFKHAFGTPALPEAGLGQSNLTWIMAFQLTTADVLSTAILAPCRVFLSKLTDAR